VVVLLGIVAVLGYIIASYRGWVIILPVLAGLGGLYFLQQFAFATLVLPELRRTLPDSAIETVVQAQVAFEIGFTIQLLVIFMELIVEKVFSGDTPLRTFADGLLGSLNVVVLLGVLGVFSLLMETSAVVLSILSAILALQLVETVVDFAIALAERG
jgi:hypothetical protein